MVSKISAALAAITSVIDRFREFLERFFSFFPTKYWPIVKYFSETILGWERWF